MSPPTTAESYAAGWRAEIEQAWHWLRGRGSAYAAIEMRRLLLGALTHPGPGFGYVAGRHAAAA